MCTLFKNFLIQHSASWVWLLTTSDANLLTVMNCLCHTSCVVLYWLDTCQVYSGPLLQNLIELQALVVVGPEFLDGSWISIWECSIKVVPVLAMLEHESHIGQLFFG